MGFLDLLCNSYVAFDQRFGPKPSGPSWRGTADMHAIANDYEASGDLESAASYRQSANRHYLALIAKEKNER